MNLWLGLAGTLAGIIGGLLLYVASPQQQLRAAGPWPTRHAWWPGTLLVLLSLVALWPLLASLEAITTWLMLLMLVWSLAPFLGAWRARVRAGRSA